MLCLLICIKMHKITILMYISQEIMHKNTSFLGKALDKLRIRGIIIHIGNFTRERKK